MDEFFTHFVKTPIDRLIATELFKTVQLSSFEIPCGSGQTKRVYLDSSKAPVQKSSVQTYNCDQCYSHSSKMDKFFTHFVRTPIDRLIATELFKTVQLSSFEIPCGSGQTKRVYLDSSKAPVQKTSVRWKRRYGKRLRLPFEQVRSKGKPGRRGRKKKAEPQVPTDDFEDLDMPLSESDFRYILTEVDFPILRDLWENFDWKCVKF